MRPFTWLCKPMKPKESDEDAQDIIPNAEKPKTSIEAREFRRKLFCCAFWLAFSIILAVMTLEFFGFLFVMLSPMLDFYYYDNGTRNDLTEKDFDETYNFTEYLINLTCWYTMYVVNIYYLGKYMCLDLSDNEIVTWKGVIGSRSGDKRARSRRSTILTHLFLNDCIGIFYIFMFPRMKTDLILASTLCILMTLTLHAIRCRFNKQLTQSPNYNDNKFELDHVKNVDFTYKATLTVFDEKPKENVKEEAQPLMENKTMETVAKTTDKTSEMADTELNCSIGITTSGAYEIELKNNGDKDWKLMAGGKIHRLSEMKITGKNRLMKLEYALCYQRKVPATSRKLQSIRLPELELAPGESLRIVPKGHPLLGPKDVEIEHLYAFGKQKADRIQTALYSAMRRVVTEHTQEFKATTSKKRGTAMLDV